MYTCPPSSSTANHMHSDFLSSFHCAGLRNMWDAVKAQLPVLVPCRLWILHTIRATCAHVLNPWPKSFFSLPKKSPVQVPLFAASAVSTLTNGCSLNNLCLRFISCRMWFGDVTESAALHLKLWVQEAPAVLGSLPVNRPWPLAE